MRRSPLILAAVALMACNEGTAVPTDVLSRQDRLGGAVPNEPTRVVSMMDACDPTTFNEALGEGACVRNGGVTVAKFFEQLERTGESPSWRFAPSNVNAKVGDMIVAINRGGEAHTFTEVAAFGGGFVAELNAISGNPVPAPECLNFAAIEFVPAGGTDTEAVDAAGQTRYQCCIHPWMRATVNAR